jgi:hypothetical protein
MFATMRTADVERTSLGWCAAGHDNSGAALSRLILILTGAISVTIATIALVSRDEGQKSELWDGSPTANGWLASVNTYFSSHHLMS